MSLSKDMMDEIDEQLEKDIEYLVTNWRYIDIEGQNRLRALGIMPQNRLSRDARPSHLEKEVVSQDYSIPCIDNGRKPHLTSPYTLKLNYN